MHTQVGPPGSGARPERAACGAPGRAVGEHQAGAGVVENAHQARQLPRVAQGRHRNGHQAREEAGQDRLDEVEAWLVKQDRALADAGQRLQLCGDGLRPSRELPEGQRLFPAILAEKHVGRGVRAFNRMKK